METNEKVTAQTDEVKNELAQTDMPEQKNYVDADLSTDGEELSIGDEIDVEESISVMKDYAAFTREDLLKELQLVLDTKPIETIRREVDAIKSSFYRLYRQEIETAEHEAVENETETPVEPVFDALEQSFKQLLAKYKGERVEFVRRAEEQKEQNYQRKLQIIEELKDLVNEEENMNQTFQKFHDIQNRWREVGPVPQAHVKDIWETYHHNVEKFYDYVKINKELRDLDLKRNLEVKLQLIKKAEMLLDEGSVNDAFLQLQRLHNSWRETGPVPREQKDTVWDTFKEITSQINKKHQAYFEQRKAEQQRNLELKIELCERAEKLNQVTSLSAKEWQKNSDELMQMLEDWKGIGFVPKKENGEVYIRFKVARDLFFQKRREYYKETKHETQVNLKKKKALCEQAEELMMSDAWKQTSDALISLQKQWKEVGPVPRKISDELWKRFRAACDTFFNRKTEHFSEKDSQYLGNLAAKQSLIAEIEAFTLGEDREANFESLKAFQLRWREIGYVPMKEKDKIQSKYQEAIDQKFRALKVSDGERNVMRFKDKIDTIQNLGDAGKSDRAFRNERDKMFHKILQLEGDIQLWENNIGFFAKSKSADAMIADVKHKMEKAKEEIKVLEEKIKLIDQQYGE